MLVVVIGSSIKERRIRMLVLLGVGVVVFGASCGSMSLVFLSLAIFVIGAGIRD